MTPIPKKTEFTEDQKKGIRLFAKDMTGMPDDLIDDLIRWYEQTFNPDDPFVKEIANDTRLKIAMIVSAKPYGKYFVKIPDPMITVCGFVMDTTGLWKKSV